MRRAARPNRLAQTQQTPCCPVQHKRAARPRRPYVCAACHPCACLHLPWGLPTPRCCTAAVAGERLEWRLRDVMKQADRTFRAKTKNFAVWEARVKARRAQQRSGAQAARAAAVQQQQQLEADAIKAAILAADEGQQQLAAGMGQQQGLPQQQGFWQQQAQQPPQPPQQQW